MPDDLIRNDPSLLWLSRCSMRIAELFPRLSRREATRIAMILRAEHESEHPITVAERWKANAAIESPPAPYSQWIERFMDELLRLRPRIHPAQASEDAAFAASHMQTLAPDEAAHIWASEKHDRKQWDE